MAGTPVPEIPMPTTMLLRLAVVPTRLVILLELEPLDVVVPARLKVSGLEPPELAVTF